MYLNKPDGSQVIKKSVFKLSSEVLLFFKNYAWLVKMCHNKKRGTLIQSLCLMLSHASVFFVFFFDTKQTNKVKRNPQVIHSLPSDVLSELHG